MPRTDPTRPTPAASAAPPRATSRRPNRLLSATVAFVLAPAVAAVPVPAIIDFSPASYIDGDMWTLALLLTYAHAAVIGIPVYLFGHNRIRYRPLSLALAGAVVAIAPSVVLLPWYASVIPFYGQIALCGALGGITFWWLTRRCHQA